MLINTNTGIIIQNLLKQLKLNENHSQISLLHKKLKVQRYSTIKRVNTFKNICKIFLFMCMKISLELILLLIRMCRSDISASKSKHF